MSGRNLTDAILSNLPCFKMPDGDNRCLRQNLAQHAVDLGFQLLVKRRYRLIAILKTAKVFASSSAPYSFETGAQRVKQIIKRGLSATARSDSTQSRGIS